MDNAFAEFTSWKGKELIEKLSDCSELNGRFMNLFQTVSHNLVTYTGNIRMLTDLMRQETGPAQKDSHLKLLRTVSEDLERTISDLSQIASIGCHEVVKESLNLNRYLTKIENTVNNYGVYKKATFINRVPDDASVQFNPAYMESILLNFCTNAIKYAHPDRFPVIEFDNFPENGKQVLTISDNGLGIDLDKYGESLFGLYKTFHGHENAGGFGLYLTKYQIEKMKGEVNVISSVGEGTTFKIIFND